MWAPESAAQNGHVFSETMDFAAFTLPILLAALLAPVAYALVPPDAAIPLWAYVPLVVLADVGHVWSTLFRTHLDSAENARRPLLYNATPVALFVLQAACHFAAGEAVFWTLLGYLAIFHFAKQQYGLMMLAVVRARDFSSVRRDKWLLRAGAAFPLALWHCDTSRRFDWFNRDDPFLFGSALARAASHPIPLPLALQLRPVDVVAAAYAATGMWAARCAWRDAKCSSGGSRGSFSTTKWLIIAYSWVSWGIGVLATHRVIALAFLNLFHAFPAYIIVFCATRNRWWGARPATAASPPANAPRSQCARMMATVGRLGDSFARWITSSHAMIVVYLAFLMLCGCIEEFLWEAWIWQDYTASLWTWNPDTDFSPLGYSALCSLLVLPQSTHYVLDAFIWKMGRSGDGSEANPGLKRFLALTG